METEKINSKYCLDKVLITSKGFSNEKGERLSAKPGNKSFYLVFNIVKPDGSFSSQTFGTNISAKNKQEAIKRAEEIERKDKKLVLNKVTQMDAAGAGAVKQGFIPKTNVERRLALRRGNRVMTISQYGKPGKVYVGKDGGSFSVFNMNGERLNKTPFKSDNDAFAWARGNGFIVVKKLSSDSVDLFDAPSKDELKKYYKFLLVVEGPDGKVVRLPKNYYKDFNEAVRVAKTYQKNPYRNLFIEGSLIDGGMDNKALYSWRNNIPVKDSVDQMDEMFCGDAVNPYEKFDKNPGKVMKMGKSTKVEEPAEQLFWKRWIKDTINNFKSFLNTDSPAVPFIDSRVKDQKKLNVIKELQNIESKYENIQHKARTILMKLEQSV